MKKVLIVVDMQNDFINGALGSGEAEAILPNAVDKILAYRAMGKAGRIIATKDTHFENYPETREGASGGTLRPRKRRLGAESRGGAGACRGGGDI